MNFEVEFSQEKSFLLLATRGINFDDVLEAIKNNEVLDDLKHHNEKRSNQRVLVLKIKKYVYAVPYVIDWKRKIIFLKTVYPSKVLTNRYLNK